MLRALDDERMDDILKGVSRSFYLSLQLLPSPVRRQISIAYLVARAADTLADTEVVPREVRKSLLLDLRAAFEQPEKSAAAAAAIVQALTGTSQVHEENALVRALGDCLEALHGLDPFDALATERVLGTLTTGMVRDIERFDGVHLSALDTLDQLDEHCFFAAGCVGEYWTVITHHHLHEMKPADVAAQIERGVRLGKALQYTNVIRDTPQDLAHGRCYLPKELLRPFGLGPEDLRDPKQRLRARAALRYLTDVALDHFQSGLEYIECIPPGNLRLRMTVIMPMWIGLETLAAIQRAADPLDPMAPVKIKRPAVYRLLAEASSSLLSDGLLRRLHARKREIAAA